MPQTRESKRKQPAMLYPRLKGVLQLLGENIQLARKRRGFSLQMMESRTGMVRKTCSKIESGDPSVSLGNYVKVLTCLGLEEDIPGIGFDNEFKQNI